jgi:hypothetical protein
MKKIFALMLILLAFGALGALTYNEDFTAGSLGAMGLMPLAGLAVSKETSPSGIADEMAFSAVKSVLPGGQIYMGIGSYSSAELTSIVNGMDNLATELSENYDLWGELADEDDAVDMNSTVETIETRYHIFEKKRTTEIQLKIVGLTKTLKEYVESPTFAKTARTFVVLADGDENTFLILNGLYWRAEWSAQGDNLWTVMLKTSVKGNSDNYILPYQDIDEVAMS